MGSNGSVIPFKIKEGVFPITDLKMTRFNILIEEGVDLVLHTLENAWGGEIFVPSLWVDLAEAIGPECKINVIGTRPGEKIHEEMITKSDSFTTYDLGKLYVILPQVPNWDLSSYIEKFNAKKVEQGFSYSSGSNKSFLSVGKIREIIKVTFN